MRRITTLFVFAFVAVGSAMSASAIYAETNQEPPGPMTGHGMMGDKSTGGGGGTGMMKRMGRMMDHCSNMMSDGPPSEQWRKNTPAEPEKKD